MAEYCVGHEMLRGLPGPGLNPPDVMNQLTTLSPIAAAYGVALIAPPVSFTGAITRLGVNTSAAPGVGEAYLGGNLVAAAPGAGWPPALQADHFHGGAGVTRLLSKDDVWNSHWAGVVARDGTDVVTLENYARSREDNVGGSDKRYYFQMYNSGAPLQSWHAAWANIPQAAIPGAALGAANYQPATAGVKLFTHLVTMRVGVSEARYLQLARKLYGTTVAAVKDDYAECAAPDADTQFRAALKGLAYADAHLTAQRKAKKSRCTAWGHALANAHAATAYPENRSVLACALGRVLLVRWR